MRIYLQPPQPSRGLQRIADALVRYKPEWVEVVDNEYAADLVVIYAIGRNKQLREWAWRLRNRKTKYAVIQVCLRSTMNPDVRDWSPLWGHAAVVWSYYDLVRLGLEDGVCIEFPNFYHSPLGADASVFYPRDRDEHCSYVIASSGLSRLSESVRECWLAAEAVDRNYLHIGMKHGPFGGRPDFISGVSDDELAEHLSDCEFVSALRRKEGFELPAVEGLLCGARPICFDTPDYRWAYGNHAMYIQEVDRQGVIDQLVQLFKHGAPPVTEEERQRAVERYDWAKITSGFYGRLQ